MDITKETICSRCKEKCFGFCHIGSETVCGACFEIECKKREK